MKNLPNKVPPITAEALSSGAWDALLPEFVQLKTCIEINPWHDHQSVFDHTIGVVRAVETISRFDFLYVNNSETMRQYMQEKQDGYSRMDMALLSGLFHDIAKADTMVVDAISGQTQCSNHEFVGSKRTRGYLRRMNFVGQGAHTIAEIVRLHGKIQEVVNVVIRNNDPEKEFLKLYTTYPEVYLLLLIQGYADAMGSNLSKLNPKEFKKREIIYREAINRFAVSL